MNPEEKEKRAEDLSKRQPNIKISHSYGKTPIHIVSLCVLVFFPFLFQSLSLAVNLVYVPLYFLLF